MWTRRKALTCVLVLRTKPAWTTYVDESDAGNPSGWSSSKEASRKGLRSSSKSRRARPGSTEDDIRSQKHQRCPRTDSSAPDDDYMGFPDLFHSIFTEEGVVPSELRASETKRMSFFLSLSGRGVIDETYLFLDQLFRVLPLLLASSSSRALPPPFSFQLVSQPLRFQIPLPNSLDSLFAPLQSLRNIFPSPTGCPRLTSDVLAKSLSSGRPAESWVAEDGGGGEGDGGEGGSGDESSW
jgi:hypothetical protein